MIDRESIVYGIIRDLPHDDASRDERLRVNLSALAGLPEDDGFPLLPREMFGASGADRFAGTFHTQVIHFGGSYRAIEYEWEEWLCRFEALLSRMYWVGAVVHLQTELSGNHTFTYEPAGGEHRPGDGPLQVRCEWEREGMFFRPRGAPAARPTGRG
jgi:hypothetical protein